MCARSQHNGDISSDTWTRCAASGTGASSARVRRRAASSAETISDLVAMSDVGGLQSRPLVELLVGGAASAHDVAVEVLGGRAAGRGVGIESFERGPRE